MAVYVDDMHESALGSYHTLQMCHMLADSDEELHAMAARIGVDRRWWQGPDKATGSHYDLAAEYRALAVQHGASEIGMREAAAMNTRRRLTGELGKPEAAVAWLLAYWKGR